MEENEREINQSPFLMCENYDEYLKSMSKTRLLEEFEYIVGNYRHSLDKVHLENMELQKQVDELKKRLHWIWAIGVDYDGCNEVESLKGLIDEMVELTQMESKSLDEYFTYNTTQGGKMNILSIVRKQAVKDTAKEILQEGKYCLSKSLQDWIKERYGVEVD